MDLAQVGDAAGKDEPRKFQRFWAGVATMSFATIVVAALIVGTSGGSRSLGTPGSADGSYDRVEHIRGGAVLAGGSVDGSYDRVEHLRGGWRSSN